MSIRPAGATLVLLLGSVALAAGAEPRKLLVTKAQWVDTAQHTGTMLFQGEVKDGVLTGRAYPGSGIELVVQGTVSSTGQVAGTLRTSEDQEIAGFTATLNAAQELQGALSIDGEAAASWIAPAEQLPTS